MSAPIEIVRFVGNQGEAATSVELIDETETSITYRATFTKPEPVSSTDEPLPLVVAPVTAVPTNLDVSPDPDPGEVDFDEFPELPDAS